MVRILTRIAWSKLWTQRQSLYTSSQFGFVDFLDAWDETHRIWTYLQKRLWCVEIRRYRSWSKQGWKPIERYVKWMFWLIAMMEPFEHCSLLHIRYVKWMFTKKFKNAKEFKNASTKEFKNDKRYIICKCNDQIWFDHYIYI